MFATGTQLWRIADNDSQAVCGSSMNWTRLEYVANRNDLISRVKRGDRVALARCTCEQIATVLENDVSKRRIKIEGTHNAVLVRPYTMIRAIQNAASFPAASQLPASGG